MLTTINVLEYFFLSLHMYANVCVLPYITLIKKKVTFRFFLHPITSDFTPNWAGPGLPNGSLEVVKDPNGLPSLGKSGSLLIFSPLCSRPSWTTQYWRLLGTGLLRGSCLGPDLREPCTPVGHAEQSQEVETYHLDASIFQPQETLSLGLGLGPPLLHKSSWCHKGSACSLNMTEIPDIHFLL